MISVKICSKIYYKVYNKELLAIFEVFKVYKYYLKDYIFKIFILTYYNSLWQFIDTKNLISTYISLIRL